MAEPTLHAVYRPGPTEELLSEVTNTVMSLGCEYDAYSVEPGYPITPSDGAPEDLSSVYQLSTGEEFFSVSFSRTASEAGWSGFVSVDQRRYEECVTVTVHSITELGDTVRNDLLNTAITLSNSPDTLALAADIGDGVPVWHRLPSNHEFSPKDPYPGVFDDSFDVQMANLTLFPPGAVSDTEPQTLAEHGQVIRTASGPLLIACENVLACRERQRERIADALGVGTTGY